MLDSNLLSKLDLSGVSVLVAIGPDGVLQTVDGFDRMLAAARKQVFPRIHTAVVAKRQSRSSLHLVQDSHNENIWKWKDPEKGHEEDFHLLCADTLAEAVALLTLESQTRWREIIDCSHELRDNRDFVGRAWLKERLDPFFKQSRRRYFLITGEPGAGKSAFMAESIRAEEFPIYHFIRKGMGNRDSPDAFFRSLDAQLRRRYSLQRSGPESKSPLSQKETSAEEFFADLQRVSETLKQNEQLCIWIDGLDEAYGHTAKFQGVVLPGPLEREPPKGIYFVLTSRPGEHLRWLGDPALCETVHLEEAGELNRSDIRLYLEERNRVEDLGLSERFIDEALQKSENNFLFAVLLIGDVRKLPRAERTAYKIPNGLRGWMVAQLDKVVNKYIERLSRLGQTPSGDFLSTLLSKESPKPETP